MLREEAIDEVIAFARKAYEAKERELGEEKMRMLERLVMLGTIDRLWVYHLTALDEMRQGVGLSGYGGLDPLVVFKHEAHDMWQQLTDHIRQNVVRRIFHVTLMPQAAPIAPPEPPSGELQESGPAKETPTPARRADGPRRRRRRTGRAHGRRRHRHHRASNRPARGRPSTRKVGRNDPCPCGSGSKYKKCHGAGAAV